eukprot:GHVQ01040950.1.p1 GENE.GHVQ01040950.1~~GHVQ01040950.1.p1  ORF type:complete len:209 (-),score=39.15 GHVQ01040950.1:99-656(-)
MISSSSSSSSRSSLMTSSVVNEAQRVNKKNVDIKREAFNVVVSTRAQFRTGRAQHDMRSIGWLLAILVQSACCVSPFITTVVSGHLVIRIRHVLTGMCWLVWPLALVWGGIDALAPVKADLLILLFCSTLGAVIATILILILFGIDAALRNQKKEGSAKQSVVSDKGNPLLPRHNVEPVKEGSCV